MAVLKHIASKNANYRASFDYLVYKHDEFTQKPVKDENGRPQLRDEYLIEGILCKPEGFARACQKTNKAFHKNEKSGEIKSHHYIISFDPRDREDNGLTAKEAQRMGMDFARRSFPGHQAEDVERRDFMERLCDSKAGNKHHLTKDYLSYLKQEVMTMCQKRQLYQVDLLNPASDKITEQEYYAGKRGQERLEKRNAEIAAVGLTPRTTKFETQKESLRKKISEITAKSKSFAEFESGLMTEYGISVRDKRL